MLLNIRSEKILHLVTLRTAKHEAEELRHGEARVSEVCKQTESPAEV